MNSITASEWLAELDGEMTAGPWSFGTDKIVRDNEGYYVLSASGGDVAARSTQAIAVIRNALPEVIAVVKAAESANPLHPVGVALTALERKLGETP